MQNQIRQRAVLLDHQALIATLHDHDENRAARIIPQHVGGSGMHITDSLRVPLTAPAKSNTTAPPMPDGRNSAAVTGLSGGKSG